MFRNHKYECPLHGHGQIARRVRTGRPDTDRHGDGGGKMMPNPNDMAIYFLYSLRSEAAEKLKTIDKILHLHEGAAVFPCGLFQSQHPNITPDGADTEIQVQVDPHSTVLYWASEPTTSPTTTTYENPDDAYASYSNGGIVTAGSDGMAILSVRQPSSYFVPHRDKPLPIHVHYRTCSPNRPGMLSPVYTTSALLPSTTSTLTTMTVEK